jgi:hypothetical protein
MLQPQCPSAVALCLHGGRGVGGLVERRPAGHVCSFALLYVCGCVYNPVQPQVWSSEGLVLVGFEQSTALDGSTTLFALCATLHLTDFSGVTEPEVRV